MRLKKTQERIDGLTADLKVAQSNPVGEDSFSMTIKGNVFTDKKIAGEAIIEVCKTFEKAEDKMDFGEYRGFPMKLFFKSGKFKIDIKQNITHTTELEDSITGNITRINNVIEAIPNKINNLKERVDTLCNEMESAKVEANTPFKKESEFIEKCKRLKDLNAELDNENEDKIDEHDQEHTESTPTEKPSILQALKGAKSNQIPVDKQPIDKSLEKDNII